MSHFSFTRTKYDSCASTKKDEENMHSFNLNVDAATQNVKMCHPSMSTINGYNGAYGIPESQIDISSDLRGQTRALTKCPQSRYNPMRNCGTCENCDTGLPCGCDHCKKTQEMTHCSNLLTPTFTRLNKPCNIFAGITIDRFDPLFENVQMNSQSLPLSGDNTRLQVKDAFEKAKEPKSSGEYNARPVECKPLNKRRSDCK